MDKKNEDNLVAGTARAMFDLAVSANMKSLKIPKILDKIREAAAKGQFEIEHKAKMSYVEASQFVTVLRAHGFDVMDDAGDQNNWTFGISWDEP